MYFTLIITTKFLKNNVIKKLRLNGFNKLFKANFLLNSGGAKRDRTVDLLRAKQALSQLSYGPVECKLVGLGRLELPTSPLSGVRSNQLSYRPLYMGC